MRHVLLFAFCLALNTLFAQADFWVKNNFHFTHADTLRGKLTPERACYNVLHYDLNLDIDIEGKSISGSNVIQYSVINDFKTLQLDLFANLSIDRIECKKKSLKFRREANAVFVSFKKAQLKGTTGEIKVYYHGKPTEALNAPWDGGFTWGRDSLKRPFVAVSCEGIGASLWYPCKDHLSDEPDNGADMTYRVPKHPELTAVGNGRLIDNTQAGYHWKVVAPINNYNITLDIANYTHFGETYTSADGKTLALNYYVLDYNIKRAQHTFAQVKPMLAAYEKRIGNYAYYQDGYKLVETPFVGMEHQSSIAYGNKYMRGYSGRQMDEVNFDFIIIHESGHEWFGNAVSCRDLAEMWIHEAFTTYMESVYVEELYSYDIAMKYINYHAPYVVNKTPMIGPYNVNFNDHNTDIYYKGSLMLNTLRHAIANDVLWWDILRTFYNEHINDYADRKDFAALLLRKTGKDYSTILSQYLDYPELPLFEYGLRESSDGKSLTLKYRWRTDVKGFDMPLRVGSAAEMRTIIPTNDWQETQLNMTAANFRIANGLFYIRTKQLYE